jgi:Kef-type K+ transport system membrane component KefB
VRVATFGGPGVAIFAIGGGLAWALFVILAAPRILAPLAHMVEREGQMSLAAFAYVMIAFCVSAFLMDVVGIHAIFGGFILGAVMPRGLLTTELKRKLEPLTVVLLLPMFFTYSGLNTRMDMVNSASVFMIALGILAASILAKGGACYFAARLSGEDNRTALDIGALMNSCGLMELIINIGLKKGIIGPTLFSMLVLMAIVTTMMASPLFELFYGRRGRETGELATLDTATARAI